MNRIQRNILLQLCSVNDELLERETNNDEDHSHLRKALHGLYNNCTACPDIRNVSEAYELVLFVTRKYL